MLSGQPLWSEHMPLECDRQLKLPPAHALLEHSPANVRSTELEWLAHGNLYRVYSCPMEDRTLNVDSATHDALVSLTKAASLEETKTALRDLKCFADDNLDRLSLHKTRTLLLGLCVVGCLRRDPVSQSFRGAVRCTCPVFGNLAGLQGCAFSLRFAAGRRIVLR